MIGVIAGILMITAREIGPFLLSSTTIIVAALSMQVVITAVLNTIPEHLIRLTANVVTLLGTAVIVVALRAIYDIFKSCVK